MHFARLLPAYLSVLLPAHLKSTMTYIYTHAYWKKTEQMVHELQWMWAAPPLL